jgi:hypothetical protein
MTKSSSSAYPGASMQDAQNGSTISGFGRHLRDFVKYVNHGMPAEEARFGINLADFYYIMRHIILARL